MLTCNRNLWEKMCGFKRFLSDDGHSSLHFKLDWHVQKNPPLTFSDIFPQRLGIFSPNFTRPSYVPIYARLQIFIQLAAILTKLCHIKHNHTVHIICSKCPPSAETHAFRHLRKSLIALLIVICGKSSQICCSAFLAVGLFVALTEVCEMLEASHPTHGSRVG